MAGGDRGGMGSGTPNALLEAVETYQSSVRSVPPERVV
jgi:hypothetical protein